MAEHDGSASVDVDALEGEETQLFYITLEVEARDEDEACELAVEQWSVDSIETFEEADALERRQAEVKAAGKAVVRAFAEYGLEGYLEAEDQDRLDRRRTAALGRLRKALEDFGKRYACEACCDTHRVPVSDDDDTTAEEPVHFTDCYECNENEEHQWDDDRCPECGGRFVYPVCIDKDCLGTAEGH